MSELAMSGSRLFAGPAIFGLQLGSCPRGWGGADPGRNCPLSRSLTLQKAEARCLSVAFQPFEAMTDKRMHEAPHLLVLMD